MELPVKLNFISAVVEGDLQEMRIFAAGVAKTPDKDTVFPTEDVADVLCSVLAITVVPSHNLQSPVKAPVSVKVTVPVASHVPLVPCAMLGPSK